MMNCENCNREMRLQHFDSKIAFYVCDWCNHCVALDENNFPEFFEADAIRLKTSEDAWDYYD